MFLLADGALVAVVGWRGSCNCCEGCESKQCKVMFSTKCLYYCYLVDPASFGTLNLELKPCKLLSVVPQGKAFSVYGSVYR